MNSSIARAIGRLQRLKQLDGLQTELESAADDLVIPDAQQYPPERANQRYIRTYLLKNNWTRSAAQRTGSGFRLVVKNDTDYAPHVVGNDQSPYHKGRWRTITQIRNANTPAVRARLAGALKRLGSR